LPFHLPFSLYSFWFLAKTGFAFKQLPEQTTAETDQGN
jgi:hypothetical protein